ncbi:hypothetical protein [Enterococcus sp. AZ102]|uniref:hypothetical protein n=1 Tax=Enterococcus sp. AZ102 TaxID=2774865 RepID=UPI003F214BD8
MINKGIIPDRDLKIPSSVQPENKLTAKVNVVVETAEVVVISLEEYDRLKEIENKYNKEHSSDSTMRMQIDLDGIHVTYDKNIILNVSSKSEEETK